MRIDVLTLFPEMIHPVIHQSIVGRAIVEKKLTIHVVDFREHSLNKHHKVDDYPYGGGAGMVLQVEPVIRALRSIENYQDAHKIIMTPQGIPYHQSVATTLSQKEHLVILCGHYEGFDERIRAYFDQEISLGDYVLTGGEIAALAVIESTVRLMDGVLNNAQSTLEESFGEEGLLEYPHYTRPHVFEGKEVPDVLRSGDHQAIESWRKIERLQRTKTRRPDLYKRYLNQQKK